MAINIKRKSSGYFIVPPRVELQLGSTLNAQSIKEGDDVYFECKVLANPANLKITWRHNVSRFLNRLQITHSSENISNSCIGCKPVL